MYGKFVSEVQVKCGTFTPNAWSLAGLKSKYLNLKFTTSPLAEPWGGGEGNCTIRGPGKS